MSTEPSGPPPTPPAQGPLPPPPPGPGASPHEWRAWRRQQRGWYGPGTWAWGGVWGWFWGAALIVLGAYFLLNNLGLVRLRGDVLWPIFLILFGVLLLVSRARRSG